MIECKIDSTKKEGSIAVSGTPTELITDLGNMLFEILCDVSNEEKTMFLNTLAALCTDKEGPLLTALFDKEEALK